MFGQIFYFELPSMFGQIFYFELPTMFGQISYFELPTMFGQIFYFELPTMFGQIFYFELPSMFGQIFYFELPTTFGQIFAADYVRQSIPAWGMTRLQFLLRGMELLGFAFDLALERHKVSVLFGDVLVRLRHMNRGIKSQPRRSTIATQQCQIAKVASHTLAISSAHSFLYISSCPFSFLRISIV